MLLTFFISRKFIGRTDVEAETPILWPCDVDNWLIWKDPDAGKDWGQEEKWMTEDEMVGRHHRHNGHGFAWTLGVGDGQGGLVCCSSWDRKESDMTEWLNWTEQNCLIPHSSEISHHTKGMPCLSTWNRKVLLITYQAASNFWWLIIFQSNGYT